jgi:hypothetical protein
MGSEAVQSWLLVVRSGEVIITPPPPDLYTALPSTPNVALRIVYAEAQERRCHNSAYCGRLHLSDALRSVSE